MSTMRQERERRESPSLEMTPMIDVVFLLLIFFVVALQQDDILAHLDVTRPDPVVEEPVIPMFKVVVREGGYVLDGVLRNLQGMDAVLGKVAKFDRKMSVILECTSDSKHGDMIQLLDVCAKHNLRNISVFSL